MQSRRRGRNRQADEAHAAAEEHLRGRLARARAQTRRLKEEIARMQAELRRIRREQR
jgi:chaperonin cofactor prefoldin